MDIDIDPVKNFVPRQNPVRPAVVAESKYIPDLTDDDLRKLARERLSEVLQTVKGSIQPDLAIRAVNAVLDRLDGRPSQSVAMTVEDKGISKLSTDRLLALERELARLTGQDAIVIAPMPSKLVD